MLLLWATTVILLVMATGATCYSLIAIYAGIRFRRSAPPPAGFTPPVSVVKPLCGLDRELESNLESFCRQDYPSYEILFSVRQETDPAVPLVRRLQKNFPAIPIRLFITGPPKYLNAKVHGLEIMAEAARHDVFVISDSDVRVRPEYLRSVVAPLGDPDVGMVTCLSLGVPASSFWSVMEALGMNTQFFAGVVSAWLLIGMQFSLGPTMAIRRQQVREIGGFGILGDYLADDFVLGDRVASVGYRVVLSKMIPDHLFGGDTMRQSLEHRLRWERSSRCSRPAGYVGQIFMHGLPLALLALLFAPEWNAYVLGIAGACIASRALVAWEVGGRLMRDPLVRKYWWLLPLEDLLSFGLWCWALFGHEIVWRGERFRVLKGGELIRTAKPKDTGVPVNVE